MAEFTKKLEKYEDEIEVVEREKVGIVYVD